MQANPIIAAFLPFLANASGAVSGADGGFAALVGRSAPTSARATTSTLLATAGRANALPSSAPAADDQATSEVALATVDATVAPPAVVAPLVQPLLAPSTEPQPVLTAAALPTVPATVDQPALERTSSAPVVLGDGRTAEARSTSGAPVQAQQASPSTPRRQGAPLVRPGPQQALPETLPLPPSGGVAPSAATQSATPAPSVDAAVLAPAAATVATTSAPTLRDNLAPRARPAGPSAPKAALPVRTNTAAPAANPQGTATAHPSKIAPTEGLAHPAAAVEHETRLGGRLGAPDPTTEAGRAASAADQPLTEVRATPTGTPIETLDGPGLRPTPLSQPVAATARPLEPALPVPADEVAVHVVKAAERGQTELQMRLHPEELGRIDVRLAFDGDNGVKVQIVADEAHAVDVLQRHGHELERALQQSGFEVSRDGIRYDVGRDPQAQAEAGRDGQRSSADADDKRGDHEAQSGAEASERELEPLDPTRVLDVHA